MIARSTIAIAATAIVSCAVTVSAQNTSDVNAGIQFDFSQSGARSLGIGGAFVAVADDATAAYGNPAGLIILTRPQISGEIRQWNWASTLPYAGHAYGPVSGIGVDTITGLVDHTFTDQATGPSFGSFVMPLGRWRVGAFARELTRYQLQRTTGSPFYQCVGSRPNPSFCDLTGTAAAPNIDRGFPANETLDLNIRSLGVSTAVSVTDSLWIGAGVQYARFHIDSTEQVFSPRANEFGPVDTTNPTNVEDVLSQHGDDAAWAANAGVLWRLNDHWSLAGSVQQGPGFTFQAISVTGPANVSGAGKPFNPDMPVIENPFKVPDHYAAGFVFRPNPTSPHLGGLWLISFEYDRVQYSQLLGSNYRSTGELASSLESQLFAKGLTLDDSNMERLGLEYTILTPAKHIAEIDLRLGTFYDPEHQTYFRPDDPSTGYPDPRAAVGFPKGIGQFHGSTGLGIVIDHMRVDFAVDVAHLGNTFALSFGYLF